MERSVGSTATPSNTSRLDALLVEQRADAPGSPSAARPGSVTIRTFRRPRRARVEADLLGRAEAELDRRHLHHEDGLGRQRDALHGAPSGAVLLPQADYSAVATRGAGRTGWASGSEAHEALLGIARHGLPRREGRPAKRVVIVGAGMAGLVAAWELARAGPRPDRARGPGARGGRVHSAARAVHRRALRRGGRHADPADSRPHAHLLRAFQARADAPSP